MKPSLTIRQRQLLRQYQTRRTNKRKMDGSEKDIHKPKPITLPAVAKSREQAKP